MTFVRQHWRDATLVCVSHDVAETQDFDRVLVVDAGAIVEDGDPRELADADSRYRALLTDRARCAGTGCGRARSGGICGSTTAGSSKCAAGVSA